MANLRLLHDGAHDGATNMARDEALLATADGPSLRLYSWQPATVSLGYFQDLPTLLPVLRGAATAAGRAVPALVRRITGGGAIWHQDEVTYCLVGVLGADGFPERARELYPLVHGAVARCIREAGGSTLALQAVAQGDRRYREEPRCFASPAIDDLTDNVGGGKVLGSAARQRGERILVHGSLKLASNPWDAGTVAGCGLAAEVAGQALQDGISQALGLPLVAGDWSARELAAAADIRHARYGSAQWVELRQGPRP
jgi:lipoate-protein ligase A